MLWVDNCQGGPITNLLLNDTAATEYTISNIPPGSTCRFQANTLNIIGYSKSFTPVLPVLFAALPNAPEKPVYVERHGGDVISGLEPFITISWAEPIEKGGVPILGYEVWMSFNAGAYYMAYDGTVEPEAPQFKFQGLTSGGFYAFKVLCRNVLGKSPLSEPLEVYAATYPYHMDRPTLVSAVPNSLESTLTIAWDHLTVNNGGLAVQGFYLQINSGYGTDFTSTLVQKAANDIEHTFSQLIAGASYRVRISAFNILEAENKQYDDELMFSDYSEFLVANEPAQVTGLQ
jgi:hypothetical protein